MIRRPPRNTRARRRRLLVALHLLALASTTMRSPPLDPGASPIASIDRGSPLEMKVGPLTPTNSNNVCRRTLGGVHRAALDVTQRNTRKLVAPGFMPLDNTQAFC